jgi:predicted alpha/beta superfamily hydrolase
MLRGDVPVAEGMRRIAYGPGWPIPTEHGFLVAVPHTGQRSVSVLCDGSGWRPRPLEQHGPLWWGVVPAIPGASLRYKLQAGGAPYPDPWARAYRYDAHGEMSLTCGRGAHIERWPFFCGAGLAPRTLRVWVPRGIATHHLYAHDGQNLFGHGWHLETQVGAHTLVVGIDHGGVHRIAELTAVAERGHGGNGAAYAAFVAGKVRRFVEGRYGAPAVRGTLGASLGGLMALYQTVHQPGLFQFAASLSGTVGWADRHLASLLTSPERCGHAVLYMDSGGGPQGGDNYEDNRALADTLAGRGFRFSRDLWHWHQPHALHNEVAWRARVARPLALFQAMGRPRR